MKNMNYLNKVLLLSLVLLSSPQAFGMWESVTGRVTQILPDFSSAQMQPGVTGKLRGALSWLQSHAASIRDSKVVDFFVNQHPTASKRALIGAVGACAVCGLYPACSKLMSRFCKSLRAEWECFKNT